MTPPVIETSDLRFAYPDGTDAILGISCRIMPGEAVAIVGGNGAGKSTLLLHFNGCLSPSGGEVRIDGRPITRQNLATVRRTVGMVFQDPDDQLFMPTVGEDVAFGPMNLGLPADEVETQVAAALERVGMSALRKRPPHKLSAGEKRAVAIATVLAMSPDALVMDEPTSHLDPRARRRLIALLQGFPHARVIATHDLEMVVEVCQRVLVMDDGRIVAEGSPHDVLDDEALMLAHGLERPHILRHQHPHR